METCLSRPRRVPGAIFPLALSFMVGTLMAAALSATSVIPIGDKELSARADVVVHGIVVSNEVVEGPAGRPETVTVIQPLDVIKGRISGALVLRQLGGELPDGRFFKMFGRPEYVPGHEVVVFAVARPEGDFQTAELMLGKFEVQEDEAKALYAVPALAAAADAGVTVLHPRRGKNSEEAEESDPLDPAAPRPRARFLGALRSPGPSETPAPAAPAGKLRAIVHPEYADGGITPQWGNIGSLWRYNNGAAAVWTLDGQANVTGGGVSEATAATKTWTDEPNSTISYTIGTGGANPIHLNALSSPCGWSTCMSSGGVIGCGGPGGGGSNSWRNETYSTITGGEVWLRSYCSMNLWDSVTTQSVLTHELGHTLGLGHSDQDTSTHDVCRGDEDAATMRSYVQHRLTLGTDDSDAVRWLYGDGGNSCNGQTPPDLVVSALAAPAAAVAGSQVSVTETTKNQGGDALASTTRYYLSANATWEAADVPIGARGVAALGAGDSSPATVLLTIPAGTATGNYYVLARADADASNAESNETNNVRADSIHIGPPDLVVSAVAAPALGGAGQSVTVTDTTRNQAGTGPAPASITRFYLSRDAVLDASDVLLGSRNVAALQPGESSAGSTSLPIPASTGAGAWWILAKADGGDSIAETVETNNTRSDTITIGPNLAVSALSAPSTGGAGMAITVTDTTKNSGGGAAASSTTSFYLSANSSFGAGDILLGSRVAGALAAGTSTAPVSTSLTIPAGTAPGSFYLIARADDLGAVAETDETDNTRAVLIRISPDLIVSALTVPASAAAGAAITISDTTKNQGQGVAGATTTRLYLSTNSVFDASDLPLASREVPVLAYGASSAAATPVTIPTGTAPGTWYILARADDAGAVAENNEGNNVAARAITISAP